MARIVINKDAEFMNIGINTKGSLANGIDLGCLPNSAGISRVNLDTMSNSEFRVFSPYMPIDYIKSLPMRFSWKKFENIHTHKKFSPINYFDYKDDWINLMDVNLDNVFIQFTISAESYDIGSDGKKNKIFQVLTFPVNILNTTYNPNGNGVLAHYEDGIKVFDNQTTYGTDKELYFEGPVIISGKLSTLPGKKLKIYSLRGFELLPGAEISPDVELIPHAHFAKQPQQQKTYSQVKSFCNSTISYKANTFSSSAIQNMEEVSKIKKENKKEQENQALKDFDIDVAIFPNPADDNFTIKLSQELGDVSILLMDVSGKEVRNYSYANFGTGKLNISALESGVYFVKVKSSIGTIGIKRLVIY